MNYPDSVRFLYALGNEIKTAKLGLERIRKVLAALGDPQRAYRVVQVGLGGRLDATNVVEPALTVITPVDFDHEIYLGHTLESIAAEKAGILKLGVPVVFAKQRAEAAAVLNARAAELGIPVTHAESFEVRDLAIDARGSCFSGLTVPLAGEHQVDNAITAALALEALGVSPKGI